MSPLFCKPTDSAGILYSRHDPGIQRTITFRSLDIKNDLPLIHEWVNMEYAVDYWQMNGHFSQLYAIYQCMEHNPYAHSFIGLMDNAAICQYDVYSVQADELRYHVDAGPGDCGIHLLMAPKQKKIPGLTRLIVRSFLDYYFSFPEARRMFAEPDINNHKSIALLEACGFRKIKTVEMSYKTAHVYSFPS